MHIVVLTTWGIWQYIFYMLSSEDILEFLRSALHRSKFISAVKNTRGLYLGNLTLTKIQSINSETPCVHVDRCSETYEWNRSINLIGHIWHPYFSEHTGIAECVRVSKNLQSNSQQQNNLRPELFWGMSGVDLKITTIRDSGISGYVRIPPSSLVSPGCCTLSRCVRLRGYTRERGAPVVLTILLFQKYCRQFMCVEMEILLVFIPGILSKKVFHKCYTGLLEEKLLST